MNSEVRKVEYIRKTVETKVLITICTPTINNVRGASALPYHLILGDIDNYRKHGKNVKYIIYSFNLNSIPIDEIRDIEPKLNAEIHIVSVPLCLRLILMLHLSFLRVFLKYPLMSYLQIPKSLVAEIHKINPDGIWIYGEEISSVAKHFKLFSPIVTMPDCESLFYYRMLSKRFVTKNILSFIKNFWAYQQYRRLERDAFLQSAKYHFVGEKDRDFYQEINPAADAVFLRHPLYEFVSDLSKPIFSDPIKLLIAGRYDFYMQEAVDEALSAISENADVLSGKYVLTFLGKGWEKWNAKLKAKGFITEVKTWVDDYAKELRLYDIQLTPIVVGTGTKGKVLDAISNGLLVIGTRWALENIDYENNGSAIEYSNADELVSILKDIPSNPNFYEQIACEGYNRIIKRHDKSLISHQLFDFK